MKKNNKNNAYFLMMGYEEGRTSRHNKNRKERDRYLAKERKRLKEEKELKQ
jgi:hypothetical protein